MQVLGRVWVLPGPGRVGSAGQGGARCHTAWATEDLQEASGLSRCLSSSPGALAFHEAWVPLSSGVI